MNSIAPGWTRFGVSLVLFQATMGMGRCQPVPILEQSSGPPFVSTADNAPFFLQDLAQKFTVGLIVRLARVEVFMNGDWAEGDLLEFDLRPTSNGLPLANDDSALVNRTLSPSSLDGWLAIDFADTPIPVSPGDVLSIVLRSPDASGGCGWYGVDWGNYAGGQGVVRDPTVTDVWGGPGLSAGDLGFPTFVIPAGPESKVLGPVLASFGVGMQGSWRSTGPVLPAIEAPVPTLQIIPE